MRITTTILCVALAGCGRFGFDAPPGCPAVIADNVPYAAGAGTSDDPFQLCSPSQLIELALRPSDFGSRFVLTYDVDLTGVEFPGIGTSAAPFTGYLDGNGHTVSNVTITPTAGEPAGFINAAVAARVEDLRIDGISVSGAAEVGAVVGSCDNAQFRNSSVTAAEIRGERFVGGLVGDAIECRFLGASFDGRVEGSLDSIGGIVGMAERSTFVDINATVEVNAPLANEVGGVVGTDAWSPVTLQNVVVEGSVVGNEAVGGLVGLNGDGSDIYRSRFSGTIHGNRAVGGFAGGNYDSPFHVYASSVAAQVTGTDGVGGFSGQHYYRTRFIDSYFTGTLTGVGSNQRAFGGFFGDVEYYGWAERSYVDVTIDSQAATAGGFMGYVGYWSANAATYDITRSFSAASVTGSSPASTISLWVGQNVDPNPFTGAGSVYWSGAGCTNLGGGGCAAGGTPVADRSQLQQPTSAPLATWDFARVWEAQSGGFPTLRLAQDSAPIVMAGCPRVAIVGLAYDCTPQITDADLNEVRITALEAGHTCTWMTPDQLSLRGTPPFAAVDPSCTAAFSVTDGPNTTPTETVPVDIYAGVVMTPATQGQAYHSFGFQPLGSPGVTQVFTLTNREAVAVTGLAITGLPAGDFQFAGGAYPGTGGTCVATLAPGATCTVALTYAPTVAGQVSTPVDIHFTATRGPASYAFTLSGYGQ